MRYTISERHFYCVPLRSKPLLTTLGLLLPLLALLSPMAC